MAHTTGTNTMAAGGTTGGGSGSPCGACKFLRRKCAVDCVFAPYFCSEQGPSRFAAIHKVFGASNVSKLLLHLPVHERCEAVVTIAYEAQARIRDPVYGCVAHIFALQQQVSYLQAQLMQAKTQLANSILANSRNNNNNNDNHHPSPNQWLESNSNSNNNNTFHHGAQTMVQANYCQQQSNHTNNCMKPISPQSSLESIDQAHSNDAAGGRFVMMQDHQYRVQSYGDGEFSSYQMCGKKRPHHGNGNDEDDDDMSELQELALLMMRQY